LRRFCLLFFSMHLSFLVFSQGGVQPQSKFNWINIWLCFFFGLLFTMLFRFLNRKKRTVDQRRDAGQPLSGWLLFLGVNLIARIILQAYFFLNENYFQKSAWIQVAGADTVRFHTLMIFEMFLSLFALSGTGALLYWFYGKRDIFPAMFIYYAVFYLLATIIQLLIYHYMVLPAEMMTIRRHSLIHLFRFVYGAVWVLYIWKSKQVKQTFIYPS
jgi:hypothetical protein